MSKSEVTRTAVVVRPMRFTAHLSRMREFLSVLGFSPRVSRPGSWATMVGGSGDVALHDSASSATGAQSGQTDLAFEGADADALAGQLAAAGFADVEIYDEAWGRVLRVRGQDDGELLVDERPTDLYGYRLDEPRPEHGIVSMPLLFGSPTDLLDGILSAVGFTRLHEGGDERWRVWRGTGGGLIAQREQGADTSGRSVQLGFRTREPLTELADRLTCAGYTGVALSDRFDGELTVTDPDGQPVLGQPVPQNEPS